MIDNKTQRLQLPLPDVDNYLEDDVARLQQSLHILDNAATVGLDGKIPVEQLPAVAITDTFPVDSEAAMLALVAEPGDVAIRSDVSKTFILMAAPATDLANWKELLNNAVIRLTPQIREALRRSYAAAGYNLVAGSFELGATVNSATDVILYEKTGAAYSWDGIIPPEGKSVPVGSAPESTGGVGVGAWLSMANSVGQSIEITLSQAQAGFGSIGSKYIISDTGMARVIVVSASDVGGFYYGTNAAGHKLKLVFDGTITAQNMMMVPGAGNDNSAKLAQLNNFEWNKFSVDDYYEFTSNVEISKPGKQVAITGNGTLSGVGAYLTVSGSITNYGVITAAEAKGGRKVTVTNASGIEIGDTVCIHNQNANSFSAHRPEYTAGEFNTVIGKSGNQLTLKNKLMFDYTGLAGIKLFKMNLVKFRHDGVNISTTGSSPYALRVKFGDVIATGKPNITAKGTTACAASLVYDKCPSVSFDLGDVYNDTVGSSTQYGISFSSCWNAVGYAKSAWGYRHGVTTGGDAADCSIPCLNILVKDGTVIGNDPASGIYAADFHGNTIDSYYRNCVIYGDIGLAGENVGCPGSTIYAQRANYPIDLHEVVGGVINLDGVKIKPLPTFNFSELIGFSASSLAAKVDRAFTVRAHGISCQLTSAVQRVFNLLFNQSSSVSSKSAVDVDGVALSGDQSGLVEIARLIQQAPGIRPDMVRMKGLPRLTDAQKYVSLIGTFQGCVMSLPSVTSQTIDLTIAGGGWFSSTGGVGGYALHTFPHYPIAPQAVAVVENQVRAESPKVLALVDSIGTNNITAYIATDNSSLTIAGGSTKKVRLTAVFENMVLP